MTAYLGVLMKLRRIVPLLAFALALPAVAQQYPAKPVRLLIGYAAGSSTDIVGRVMADRLGGELFNMMAGITAIHVPYKGGAPAVQDVIPGRVAYYFAGMPVGLPLANSGRARALGVTSKQRYPAAPNVPTIAEQGLPQYEAPLWQGFFAPVSISPELGARIARDVEAVLKQPETRANLAKVGVALFEDNQANFIKFFRADIEKWRNLVKSTNLKLE